MVNFNTPDDVTAKVVAIDVSIADYPAWLKGNNDAVLRRHLETMFQPIVDAEFRPRIEAEARRWLHNAQGLGMDDQDPSAPPSKTRRRRKKLPREPRFTPCTR